MPCQAVSTCLWDRRVGANRQDGTGVPPFVAKHACRYNETIAILDLVDSGII